MFSGLLVAEREECLLDAPVKLLVVHTLPGENRNTCGCNGGGGVILRRENIAGRPGNLCTELNQRFNQHGSLDGHVQAAGDACALQRFGGAKLFTERHEPRHFSLGKLYILATHSARSISLTLYFGRDSVETDILIV
jgi:hypothetical protein